MKPLKPLIALLAVALLTTSVDARHGIHLRSRDFRFDMIPVDPNATSSGPIATANCVVRIKRRRGVVLQWTTGPFVHTSDPELTSDAFLAATVTQQNGRIFVSPQQVIDQTDLSGGDDTAAITMAVQGKGRARIKLQVGIDNQNAAAGKHSATVVVTVTAL